MNTAKPSATISPGQPRAFSLATVVQKQKKATADTGWKPPWRSQALGTLAGTFVPEMRRIVCTDGQSFAATASPALLDWFKRQPDAAAKVQRWSVYPRSDRKEGLAFLVIGAAPTGASVDEFVIQGSIANLTTDKSRKKQSVFIRVGRNIPRPKGQKARHPNWKTRLLRLAGRTGSAGPGSVVRLAAKRVGRELRVVHVHARVAAEPDPIVWLEPGLDFSWPWPYQGKRSEIEKWFRDWFVQENGRAKRPGYNFLDPRFLKLGKLPEFEQLTLDQLKEFAALHRKLAQRAQKSDLPQEVKQRLELQSNRIEWIAVRTERSIKSIERSQRESMYRETGWALLLRNQMLRWKKAAFLIEEASGSPVVTWQLMVNGDLVQLPITGNLKTEVLRQEKQNEAPVKPSGCNNGSNDQQEPPQSAEYKLTATALGILNDIEKGANDDRLMTSYKLLPIGLAEQCRLLVEAGKVEGLISAFAEDPKQLTKRCRSAEMRRQIRYAQREEDGLTRNGLKRARPEAI